MPAWMAICQARGGRPRCLPIATICSMMARCSGSRSLTRTATGGSSRASVDASTELGGEILYPLSRQVDVSAGYRHVTTDFAGPEGGSWNIFRARGTYRPGTRLSVDAFYRNQQADQPPPHRSPRPFVTGDSPAGRSGDHQQAHDYRGGGHVHLG